MKDSILYLPANISTELERILIQSLWNNYITDIDVNCDILSPNDFESFYDPEILTPSPPIIDDYNCTFPNCSNATVSPTMEPSMTTTLYSTTLSPTILFNNNSNYTNSTNTTSIINNPDPLHSATTISPTNNPITIPILETDGSYHNYLFQCLISTSSVSRSTDLVKLYRHDSKELYYLHQSINRTFSKETVVILANSTENMTSTVNISLNTVQFYLGDQNIVYSGKTLSPTYHPTPLSGCWMSGIYHQHNSTWNLTDCYKCSCYNGHSNCIDSYCNDECYVTHTTNISGSIKEIHSILNDTCCIGCTFKNTDCNINDDCLSCFNKGESDCIWQSGNLCSAQCQTTHCWDNNDGCPQTVSVYLQLSGIPYSHLEQQDGLLKHGIATAFEITSDLILIISMNEIRYNQPKIEIRVTITLLRSKQKGIIKKLLDPTFIAILNKTVNTELYTISKTVNVNDIKCVEYNCQIDGKTVSKDHTNVTNNLITFTWQNSNAIIIFFSAILIMILLLRLCYKYPCLSYCCCLVPKCIKISLWNYFKKYRELRSNNNEHDIPILIRYCCLNANFGLFQLQYKEEMAQLIEGNNNENENDDISENNEIPPNKREMNVEMDGNISNNNNNNTLSAYDRYNVTNHTIYEDEILRDNE